MADFTEELKLKAFKAQIECDLSDISDEYCQSRFNFVIFSRANFFITVCSINTRSFPSIYSYPQ